MTWSSRKAFIPKRFLALMVAVSAGLAGWGAWSWWTAAQSEPASIAVARDEAMDAGRTAIATFNTVDYRKADEGLGRWLAASTGPLHEELARAKDSSKAKVEQARTSSEGKVIDAAITDLDLAGGTAKLIASVEIVVTAEGGQPAGKRSRLEAELTKVDSTWKLSGLGQVPFSQL